MDCGSAVSAVKDPTAPTLQPPPTATTFPATTATLEIRSEEEHHGRVFDLSSHAPQHVLYSWPSPLNMDWGDVVHADDDLRIGSFDLFALVMNRVVGAHFFGAYPTFMGVLLAYPAWQVAKTLRKLQVLSGHLGWRTSNSIPADFLAKAPWEFPEVLGGHPGRRISNSPSRPIPNFQVALDTPFVVFAIKGPSAFLSPMVSIACGRSRHRRRTLARRSDPSRHSRFPDVERDCAATDCRLCQPILGDSKAPPSCDTSSRHVSYDSESVSDGTFEMGTETSPDRFPTSPEERNPDWDQFAAAASMLLALPDVLGAFFQWSSHQPCPEPSRFQQTMMLSV